MDTKTFEQAVKESLTVGLEELKEECIKEAIKNFERDLRHKMVSAAFFIDNYVQMNTYGQNITITLKLDKNE